MKKAVLVIFVALMAVAMLAIPIVSAVPLKEKNNGKFQTFHVYFKVNAFTFIAGEHDYIPSKDNVNKLTVNGPESFIQYDLTVGSKTYKQGVDFIYTGHFEYIFYDVTAWLTIPGILPAYLWPADGGYRTNHLVVDYMYEFLPASGIDGTVQLRAIKNGSEGMAINSLAGTGDLQNVQIKAVVTSDVAIGGGLYEATHDGTVVGWPE